MQKSSKISKPEVGRPLVKAENEDDCWDIKQLERGMEDEEVMVVDCGK